MIAQFPKQPTNLSYSTEDCAEAFQIAERWAFKGFKVKLYGIKGCEWTVEVQGMGGVNLKAPLDWLYVVLIPVATMIWLAYFNYPL